jgi:hypothetical protein
VIAWHLGGVIFLFRWIFRDPKVDVRFLAAGALLPDAIDLPVGTLLLADRYSTGELWFHSLLAPTVVVVAVLLVTRRGRRRRAWMALAVGMLFHLVLDGMWTSTETFFWPFFGVDVLRGPSPYWAGAWEQATGDPVRWVTEAVGVAYLTALGVRSGLSDPRRRRLLLSEGRLTEVSE